MNATLAEYAARGWYLPETWAIFGRSSAPRSHWLYFAPEAQFEAFVASLVNQALGELGALLP